MIPITCIIGAGAFPFILAGLINSVIKMADEKTPSPILFCILMSIDLLLVLVGIRAML